MKKSKSLYFIAGMVFLVISAVMLSVYDEPSETQNDFQKTTETKEVEMTGTPADNYSSDEREGHCGSSNANSNQYIQEFEIPTPCTQPLSIVTDSNGKIWFVQTNTGNLAMFDPESEKFTEYQNEQWTAKKASMMWGITYTQDDEIWFTDGENSLLWKFSIPEKTYSKFETSKNGKKMFSQKIELYDDNFLINDFTGSQIILLSHKNLDKGNMTYSFIEGPEGYFTSQASMNNDKDIWFVIWKYQQEATLVRTNSITQETEQIVLPTTIDAPNGVSVGPLGNVWIADTAGSSFYKFIPENKKVIEFVTSNPPIWSYGNSSGLIKTPITRPYWNAFDSDGNMWFNQQTANRLAVFDTISESLIEYDIPSKNPKWADCEGLNDCGVSQSFGFAIQDKKVWFTEWAENNIGVLDASITIPISLDVKQNEIQIKQGEQKEIFVTVTPQSNQSMDLVLSGNTNSELIKISTKAESTQILDQPIQIPVTISIDEKANQGDYKILLGTQIQDVHVSSYVTITVI